MDHPYTEHGLPKSHGIFSKTFLIAAFVGGCLTVTLIRPLLKREPPLPEVLFDLPAYELVDQNGRAFGSKDIEGKVHIAAMFFTRCKTICPKITKAMKGMSAKITDGQLDIELVSMTIDPEHDTPAVLSAYAKDNDLKLDQWHLLTGDTKAITDLIMSGFKQHLGDKTTSPKGDMEIMHSGKLFLVDKHGGLRGLYDSDAPGTDEAFHRAIHLTKRTQ